MQRSSIILAQYLLCLTPVLCIAGVSISPGRYSQHEYDRHDNTPMTFDAASYACVYMGNVLEVPFLSFMETHYRHPDILIHMKTYWYWAHLLRGDDGDWRWLNGTLVDLTRNDMVNLAAQPSSSSSDAKTCAVWRLSVPFLPVSCEERYPFICLKKTDSFCRLRSYKGQKSPFNVDIDSRNYTTSDSLLEAVANSSKESAPVVYRVSDKTKRRLCRTACDELHANESLPVGCWFAQFYPRNQKNERCFLLLAPSFPDTVYDILTVADNTTMLFRTCFFQTLYVNETCSLQCSCPKSSAPTTLEEAEEEDKKIKAELIVPTHNLSATVRRKTTATDHRPSAQGIGWVGLGVVGGFLMAVIVLDMASLWRDVRIMIMNLKQSCGLEADGDKTK